MSYGSIAATMRRQNVVLSAAAVSVEGTRNGPYDSNAPLGLVDATQPIVTQPEPDVARYCTTK